MDKEKTNLLEETLEELKQNGKTPADVHWVGNRNGTQAISWTEFEVVAKNTNYDDGFGSNEIALCLVVVGLNWWLERYEYDGSERWSFQTRPRRKKGATKFTNVTVVDFNDVLS